jgi:AraC-like DNA-binding protein
MPEPPLLSFPTPAPAIAVHVKRRFEFTTPTEFVHDYHLIGLRISGSGYYMLGSERLPDKPMLASFLPAGESDICGIVDDVESWWTAFNWPGTRIVRDGEQHLNVRFGRGLSVRVKRWKTIGPAASTKMVELFRALQNALDRQQSTGVLEARAMLMSIFVYYADLPEDAGSSGHRALSRFMDLLREQACADVAIEDLAERAGISPDHARDLFRRRLGVAPVEYRTGLRMSHARELLANSTLNVKEVARRSGYPDAQYFSRVFKTHFGVSPVEIIRRYRLER